MVDKALLGHAANVLAAAPCSIEMPAGTGKTHLLATAVAVAAEDGRRSLVLTHTNAGVDAIRARLRRFGVPASMARVETLTSWAFTLSRSYSNIAGVTVGEVPDWTQSKAYLDGASKVAATAAIADMHAASFEYLFVDEYQDCSLVLHDFVLTLASTVPKTVVLGDRLQGIFTFDGPVVSWENHVMRNFTRHDVPIHPHRWTGHNTELGDWLLDIRPLFTPGSTFDFSHHNVNGLNFVQASESTTIAQTAHRFRDFNETVVILDKWALDVANHASRLGGSYSVMEDIGGRFMRGVLENVPMPGDPQIAWWFAKFAKDCVVGLAGIDAPVLKRLGEGKTVSHYRRKGISSVLAAFDALLACPTYEQVGLIAAVVQSTPGLRIYRWEAWNDTREAILHTSEDGGDPLENLARIRDRVRRRGRRPESRIASRTLLVKGLEYDHVIVADLSKMKDPCNLYVALSRARKSVTIIGRNSSIRLTPDS